MRTKIIRTSSGMRKVRVLKNGQYRFMKMTRKTRKKARYHTKRTRKKRSYRRSRRKATRRTKKKKSYSRSGGLLY